MFKNLKISTQIGTGFTAVIVIFGLLGFVVMTDMFGLRNDAKKLSNEYMSEAKIMGDMSENVLKMETEIRAYEKNWDESFLKRGETNLEDTKKNIDEAESLSEKYSSLKKLNENLPQIKLLMNNFEDYLNKTIKLKDEVNTIRASADATALEFIDSYTKYLNFVNTNFQNSINSGETKQEYQRRLNQLTLVNKIIENGNYIRVANFKFQASGDDKLLENVEEQFLTITKDLSALDSITKTDENKVNLAQILDAVKKYQKSIIDVRKIESELSETNKKRREISSEFIDLSGKVSDAAMENILTISKDSINTTTFSSVKILIGFILAVVLGTFLAYMLIKIILIKIKELSKWGKKVALGELEYEKVEVYDNEIGELYQTFISIVESFKEMSRVCEAIAHKDYSEQFNIRSDKDTLGISIDTMKNRLMEMDDENEKQNWLKNGQMKLAQLVQGELDIYKLCNKIISFSSEYIDAKVGVIYCLEGQTHNPSAKMYGNYAFTRRKTTSREYTLGEGIVGQVMVEKKMISITSIPEDYIAINSGLGESVPKFLVTLPCIYNNEIKGIVEYGSFESFSPLQLKFLESINETVAISINSAIVNTKLSETLSKSQQLTEELQVQQEELKQANQELEEQTKFLKESESKLQTQQEELRVSNEELEERTKELEEQKDIIHLKNEHLEKAQKILEVKATELEISSKYKSEFLANMSHELRTPLNSILMLAWILITNKENNLSEKQKKYAATIHSSSTDLLNLINEILDLSKVEAGKIELSPTNVDIHGVSDKLKMQFSETANNKGIDYSIEVSPDLPKTIYTDDQRFIQIIKNLLSNAFKFTHKGSIAVKFSRPDNGIVLKRKELNLDETLAISVADTGIGIPEDKQSLIFEAFQQADGTTNRKYGGTGLGLSISKELAKLLGGQLTLQSTENKGTVFTLYLPFKASFDKASSESINLSEILSKEQLINHEDFKEKIAVKAVAPLDEIHVEKNENTILIIEDDLNFAEILQKLAEESKFKGIIAENGENGLAYAKKYMPKAIILDIGLPTIDGYEVLEQLKKDPITSEIPVHVISGKDNVRDIISQGALTYTTKPVSVSQINDIFDKISSIQPKKVLLVEDNQSQKISIIELIEGKDIIIRDTDSGEMALKMLNSENFDCIILDLGIKDISGFELINRIKEDKSIHKCPIIVYTGKELTRDENLELQKYAESIIIKGAKSPERLLSETTLFLHRVEMNIDDKKKRIFKDLSKKEYSVLRDKNILIVDDDNRNIFALSSILEESEMNVIIANNGKEGLEKLKNSSNIDIVLMDIMMPEMNGYEAIMEIRKEMRFKDLPIIALTAKAMKGDKEKCIEAGANDYLAKPVDADKLISLLRVWLHR